MAYEVSMWAADGPNGESEIKRIRIKRIEEIPEIIAYWSGISDCVRICKERSGPYHDYVDLWIRPGYTDPFIFIKEIAPCPPATAGSSHLRPH